MELLLGTDIPLYLLLLSLACLLFYIYGTWPYGLWKSLGIDGSKPSPFIGVEVFGQAVVFFAARYQSTAHALQFLAYQLARYPEVQEKIVQEIKQEIGDEIPTYDGMAKLKYLDHVINETLRMFPPLNTINRTAVPIANILRDPEYFPEPDEFKPERFSEDNGVTNPASFVVFGFGPRQCIGMRLALLEIKMAMVHVLRNVKFVPTDDLQEIPARQCRTFLSPLI